MATVLAVAPGMPPELEGRQAAGGGLQLDIVRSGSDACRRAEQQVYDLLVLTGNDIDEQNDLAAQLQMDRRWRLVPVLFVLPDDGRGLTVPGCYRPDMDGLARGTLTSRPVLKRIAGMAKEGTGSVEIVVAGGVELDPLRLKLTLGAIEVGVTEREAEILAILLAHANRTVSASEIIQRGWGVGADRRYLQILRRHVSNIRRKLNGTPAARSVKTVRGSGYRFDVPSPAGLPSTEVRVGRVEPAVRELVLVAV